MGGIPEYQLEQSVQLLFNADLHTNIKLQKILLITQVYKPKTTPIDTKKIYKICIITPTIKLQTLLSVQNTFFSYTLSCDSFLYKSQTLVYISRDGWTTLNKNPSWSWSFLAPIILLELELLGSNNCDQNWSWSFQALKFFIELELELTSSRLFFPSFR